MCPHIFSFSFSKLDASKNWLRPNNLAGFLQPHRDSMLPWQEALCGEDKRVGLLHGYVRGFLFLCFGDETVMKPSI